MDTFEAYLDALLYKMISIYITSLAEKPLVFSGILVSLTPDSIRLVIKSSLDTPNSHKINFNRRFQSSQTFSQLGSIVEIPFNKIDALIHHSNALSH